MRWIISKIKYGLLALMLVSFTSAHAQKPEPVMELKQFQGFRLIFLGKGFLTDVYEAVTDWVTTENQDATIKLMLTDIQTSYKYKGMLLVLAGIGKELAPMYGEDPEQAFKGMKGPVLAGAQREKYITLVTILLDLGWDLTQKKYDKEWFDYVMDRLNYSEEYRQAYFKERQVLEKLRPINPTKQQKDVFDDMVHTKSKELVSEFVVRNKIIDKFMSDGMKSSFVNGIVNIFGPKRIYAVTVGIEGKASIPLGTITAKAILRRELPEMLKDTLDNAGIAISGGALFVVKGEDKNTNVKASNFATTTFKQYGGSITAPTVSVTGNKSQKQLSVAVRLNFIYSDSKLEGFKTKQIDNKPFTGMEITGNAINGLDGFTKKLVTELSKAYDANGSFSIFKDNVTWSPGLIPVDEEDEGKAPDKVLSFTAGGFKAAYAKDTEFKGFVKAGLEVAPMMLDGEEQVVN